MKILGKILALLLVGLSLFSAIAVFYETQVSIPKVPPESNPHVEYLRRHSMSILGLNIDDEISESDSICFLQNESLEDEYHRQLISLKRFHEEHLISDFCYNCLLDTFMLCYTEAFIYQAHCMFHKRIWPEVERYFYKLRISNLESLTDISGNKVLSQFSDVNSQLHSIEISCNDYVKATNLLSHVQYTNFSSAESHIEEANNLLSRGTLSLNAGIIEDLKNYPTRIGDDHLQLIKNLADDISKWNNYSLSTTISRYNRLEIEANAYQSNGEMYDGGHPYDISEALSCAETNKEDAVNELSYLRVDNNDDSEQTRYLDSSAGQITFSINTNHPMGFQLEGTSSDFFYVETKGSDYVTISYSTNTNDKGRSNWFNVIAGNKMIRINLHQNQHSNNPTYNEGYIDGKATINWTSSHSGMITVSVANKKGCDLDLTIIDDNGSIIAEDKTSDQNPKLTFNAPGHYTIRIYNYSNNSCKYELKEY